MHKYEDLMKVAVVYQAAPAPEVNGILKPMKLGGYADSGADIAYALRQQADVILPVEIPGIAQDLDWVFPDTRDGIQKAVNKGAEIIWLNTVLYSQHPIREFMDKGISVVGQNPENVEVYDDKIITNQLLSDYDLPVPDSVIITAENVGSYRLDFSFPVVAKPIRGRGSQGVTFVKTELQLRNTIAEMFSTKAYGDALYVEAYLPGQEVTITVMPPGSYQINEKDVAKLNYWSLPPVRRFNHENGIAPYNGTVAVINNSEVLNDEELRSEEMLQLCSFCERAAALVGAKAPIRIDCRANHDGKYFLFDLNMKPNMTGASRPHRQDQDSLSALAARKIGWDFNDLVMNMLRQYW